MTEKEMEKLFKSKLDGREFAFNPANWEKMEAILNQKASVGGAYYWRSAAAILLFGVMVASAIYYNPGMSTGYDAISGPDFIPEGKILPGEFGIDKTSNQPNKGTVAYEGASKEMKSIGGTDTKVSEVNTVARPHSLSSLNKEPVEELTSTVQISNPDIKSMVVANESNSKELDNVGIENEAVENFEALDFVQLSSKDYVLPELATLNFDVKDAELFSNGEEGSSNRKIYTNGVFVNVGPIFTGSNTNNTLGTGFLAGVGYRRALNYGLGIETGLNYFVLNNVNIENNSDSVFYRFGKERIETQEVNNRLDYLEVPLNITYKLAPKHHLGLGGYAAILLNVNRDITRTTYTPKSGTFVDDEKASGYLNEFNRFDFGLSAFYRYSVSSRLNIGLHLKQGLIDITHDVSRGYAEDHTNFNTRIVLEYSLF